MALEEIFVTGATGFMKKLVSVAAKIGKSAVVDKDLQKLKDKLEMIVAVTSDAEKKQVKSKVVLLWLRRLQDVAYDVDDLLDEISYEAMRGNMEERRITDVDDGWKERLSLPCTLFHLKFVEIESLQGCDNEFKFVEFLWKNGVVLEDMVLWFRHFPRKFSSPPAQAAIVKKFSKKLRAVPRASPNLKTTINVRITRWIDEKVK